MLEGNQSRVIVAAGVGLAMLLALAVGIPLLLTDEDDPCTGVGALGGSLPDSATAPVTVTGRLPGSVGRWNTTQLRNAAAVISAGKALGISAQGQIIGVMTAMGESSLTVVDHGDAAGPDSRGLFQQRGNGAWGSYTDRMDPTISAANFFRALQRVPGWALLSPTQAAHRTQHNADPNYYTRFYPDAVRVTSALTGHITPVTTAAAEAAGSAGSTSPATAAGTSSTDAAASTSSYTTAGGPADCGTAVLTGGGTVVYPLPAGSGYRDLRNWHSGGSHWGSWHTGTDLSVACGTPVLAATAGKVAIRTDQAWAGRWLVQVSTGPHAPTTWYAHMRAIDVRAGDYVSAGQQLGLVGDLGNATGCHLHFEIHTRNGTIYGPDNTNPTTWLATHVGKTIGISPAAATGSLTGTPATTTTPGGQSGTGVVVGAGTTGSTPDGGFRLVTFNILGDSHTGGRGADQHPTWADGSRRLPGAISILNAWGTDVAGLQEAQTSQHRPFTRVSGGGYQMVPAPDQGGDNRIIWRRSTFQLIKQARLSIPYFNGHPTSMPVVQLRQRSTGESAWFINVHNPAETATYHHQGRWRAIAVARERAAVRQLLATGHPVFLLGDLNAHTQAFCPLAAGNLLRAAAGGSHGTSGCRPPGNANIDWIFAAGTAGFTGYTTSPLPITRHISDHPIVVSQAHID